MRKNLHAQLEIDNSRIPVVIVSHNRTRHDTRRHDEAKENPESSRPHEPPCQALEGGFAFFQNDYQELFRFPAAIAPNPPKIITALTAGCNFSSCRVVTPSDTLPIEMPSLSVRRIGTTSDAMPRIR